MSDSNITVFDNINGEIRRKNISQEKLCDDLGINRRKYLDWQLKNDMPLSFFVQTALYLGCSFDYLMRDVSALNTGTAADRN